MKYVIRLMGLFLLFSFQPLEEIYDIPLHSVDGNRIELSQFKGKKLLFLLLPLSAQDTTVSVNDIAQLQAKYQSSLVIVGVPSVEAGYTVQGANALKQLYRNDILIAEGMNVKKGTQQSALFQWLTHKDKNHHFDQDVQGTGSKFFVDEEGELYAVMGANLRLTNPLVDRILARSPLKK